MEENHFNSQQNYSTPQGYPPMSQNGYQHNTPPYYPQYQQPTMYYDPSKYYPPTNTPSDYYNSQNELQKKKEKSELIKLGFIIGSVIVIYLLMQIVAVSAIKAFGLYEIYETSALFQNCFNMIGVHFMSMLLPFGLMAFLIKKHYKDPLVPTEKVGFLKGFMWICVGMGACFFANIFTNYVIKLVKTMGYELTQGEILKPDNVLTCIALVFSTAIIPGIIEEFALRCCTLGILKNYGKGFGVFAVSIVFGLLHGNVIQFIFAFIVGLVLGYITIKTGNVLIAMTIHACNNGMSVLQDIMTFATSEKLSDNVVTVVYLCWIALAVVGVIYLAVKKELIPKKTKEAKAPATALSFGAKLSCLIPGFFVPFLLLIAITATTITKIK